MQGRLSFILIIPTNLVSLRVGIGQGGVLPSLGATHGGATHCDGVSGQSHSSFAFPSEPPEGKREVLWGEEQTHTSQEPAGIWAGGSC